MNYTRLIDATDVTYQPEVSSYLFTWTAGNAVIETISTTANGDGVTRTVVVRDNTLISGTTKRFMRLQVNGISY